MTSGTGDHSIDDPSEGDDARQAALASGFWDDVVALFLSPGKLFERLPFANRYSQALFLLLAFQAAYGLAASTTGVYQYEADEAMLRQLSIFIQQHEGDEDFQAVNSGIDNIKKQAVFTKQLASVALVIFTPCITLMQIAGLAGLLFVIVAMRAGKPNYALLTGVVAFAWLVDLPQLATRLYLLSQIHATRVETSAAAFATSPEIGLFGYIALRRIDPFFFWFWGLVGLGLAKTNQLSARQAVFWTAVLALLAVLLRSAADMGELAEMKFAFGPEQGGGS